MTPEKPPYYEWDDLKNEVRLYNGSEILVFDRASMITAEQQLAEVKRLLQDRGIDKDQIFMLLESVKDQ